MYQKGTLLVPSGPSGNPAQSHLHIVCNDTCALGLNLLVPVSTFYDGCDATCELDENDHEFLRHLSFVFYAKAKLYRAEQINRGLEINLLTLQPDMADGVFQRVGDGICVSPDSPAQVRTYFGC